MWVFTRDGFFSTVWDQYCAADEVMVRTRCREDLCRLSKRLKGFCDEEKILEIPYADYRFRLKISRHEWSEYLARCALEIDYANVKKGIIGENDRLRERAYYGVWQTLYRWQSQEDGDLFK